MGKVISFRQKGDFSKVTKYLERLKQGIRLSILDAYGRKGVEVLRASTPLDSGETANSWFYKIQNDGETATISFHNSNSNDGVPIAIILQYGHGTGTGGWVQGRDYINPAIQPLFDELVTEVCWEVKRV